MTEQEFSKWLAERFKSAGLSRYVIRDKSQAFEVPEGFFVEVVLNDGSKLDETANLMASIAADVEAAAGQLISVVRTIWHVKHVEAIGPSRGKSGGIKAALCFQAVLESGGRQTEVVVEVGRFAFEKLRKSLGSDGQILEGVADFLRLQLSWGGAGYWDPIRDPRQQMNEAAVSYLLAHRPVTAA